MTSRRKILFVDDEPAIIKIMKSRLQAGGKYEVETAASGEEALARAGEYKPDLILLDICMPGIDGYEVCRRLKENPLTADIPVLMFTASQEEHFIEKGLKAGAEDVINKPFVAELTETIARIFEGDISEDAA